MSTEQLVTFLVAEWPRAWTSRVSGEHHVWCRTRGSRRALVTLMSSRVAKAPGPAGFPGGPQDPGGRAALTQQLVTLMSNGVAARLDQPGFLSVKRLVEEVDVDDGL